MPIYDRNCEWFIIAQKRVMLNKVIHSYFPLLPLALRVPAKRFVSLQFLNLLDSR
jgi:hypothetical protein